MMLADPMLPPGSRFCRCPSCGEYFLNEKAFDRHRVGRYGLPGDRRCLLTPHMDAAGLERDLRGYWRLPKRGFDSANPDGPHEQRRPGATGRHIERRSNYYAEGTARIAVYHDTCAHRTPGETP